MQFAASNIEDNINVIMTAIRFKLTLKNMAIIVTLCILLKFYVLIRGSPLNANRIKKREILTVHVQGDDVDDSKDPDFEKFERANKVMHGPKFVNPVNVENGRGGGLRGKDIFNKKNVDIIKKIDKNHGVKDVGVVNYAEDIVESEKGKDSDLKADFINKKQNNKRQMKKQNNIKEDNGFKNNDIGGGDSNHLQNAKPEIDQGKDVEINQKVDLINKGQKKIKLENDERKNKDVEINQKVDLINKGQKKIKLENDERKNKDEIPDKYVDSKKNIEEKQVFVKDGRNWEIVKKEDNVEVIGKDSDNNNVENNKNVRLDLKNKDLKNSLDNGKARVNNIKEKENLEPQNAKLKSIGKEPEIKNVDKKKNERLDVKNDKRKENRRYENDRIDAVDDMVDALDEIQKMEPKNAKPKIIAKQRNQKLENRIEQQEDLNRMENEKKSENLKPKEETKKKRGNNSKNGKLIPEKGIKKKRNNVEHKNHIENMVEFQKDNKEPEIGNKKKRNNVEHKNDIENIKEFQKDNKEIKAIHPNPFQLEKKNEMENINRSHHINMVNKRIDEIDKVENDILDKIEGPENVEISNDEEVLEGLDDNSNEIVLDHQMAGRQKDRKQIKSVLNNPIKKGEFDRGKKRRNNKNKIGNQRKRIGINSLQKIGAKKAV